MSVDFDSPKESTLGGFIESPMSARGTDASVGPPIVFPPKAMFIVLIDEAFDAYTATSPRSFGRDNWINDVENLNDEKARIAALLPDDSEVPGAKNISTNLWEFVLANYVPGSGSNSVFEGIGYPWGGYHTLIDERGFDLQSERMLNAYREARGSNPVTSLFIIQDISVSFQTNPHINQSAVNAVKGSISNGLNPDPAPFVSVRTIDTPERWLKPLTNALREYRVAVLDGRLP